MRNIGNFFNKKRSIKYIVEVNIYYWRHRERTETDMIEGKVILRMLWVTHHNSEIN